MPTKTQAERWASLQEVDAEIYDAIQKEKTRQNTGIELIASENFVSQAVLEAQGSVLTNKYAEGLPGRRYYGGCEFVDIAEELAIQRAKEIFGADHANVQPHSGAQANQTVFFAALEPGDKIMGMALPHGGHLTHGSPVNLSGKWFEVVPYQVSKETERIDYDALRDQARAEKPKLIIAGASAYPREIDFAAFRSISDEVGALLMVDMAHIAGLVAAGIHPSPVPHAQFVTTTTHKTLRGPRGGLVLCTEEYAKAIDKSVFPGLQGGPLMHVIAGKAVAFKEALSSEFAAYQQQIVANARALGTALVERGWRLVSGGTDNHLVLVDVKSRGLTGKEAEKALDEVGVTVNKNTIPYDTESPFVTSGVRIGTPAVTTRGMGEAEMVEIASIIDEALQAAINGAQEGVNAKLLGRVRELCAAYPLYQG